MARNLSDKNTDGVSPLNVTRGNLYADLDLNFLLHPGTNDIRPVTDIDAIKNAVKHLILTGQHERLFHPELGCSITSLLFENVDQFTAMLLKEEIAFLLDRHEPRINNVLIEVFDDGDRNAYYITIEFSIKATNTSTEISFFLERIR